MPNHVERFLQLYSHAFAQKDTELAASFYLLPTVIIGDHSQAVYEKRSEVVAMIDRLMKVLNAAGVEKYVTQISQRMHISETLMIINLRWQFLDNQDQLRLGYSATYTLKKMEDNELKIIVAVLDDVPQSPANFMIAKDL